MLSLSFWPTGLDLWVIGSFVAYGVAPLLTLRPGTAELPLARLASGNMPRWLWPVVALSLLMSALGDAHTAHPALLAQLDTHMREARPWLNPDLTLVALARKSGRQRACLSAR